MDFLEQYGHQLVELFHHLADVNISIPVLDVLRALLTGAGILISAYGLWKTWRFAEIRIGKRLQEFLSREEDRLDDVRSNLSLALRSQKPPAFGYHRVFTNADLKKSLKNLRWGRPRNAKKTLERSLKVSRAKQRVAERRVRVHGSQEILSNLLQGMIHDAEKDHATALTYFEAVLSLEPNDLVALEYAGLQHLVLGHPHQALEHFDTMLELVKNGNDALIIAHAHRNRGRAFVTRPLAQFGNANIAYKDAIAAFPNNAPRIDLANIHELRGAANLKLPNNSTQASKSLLAALAMYSSIERNGGDDSVEATEGRARATEMLEALNQPASAAPSSYPESKPTPLGSPNNHA